MLFAAMLIDVAHPTLEQAEEFLNRFAERTVEAKDLDLPASLLIA